MNWLLTRGRFPYLIVLAAVTAWLGLHAARVDVERDNASLTTRDPARAQIYRTFLETFGTDEDMLLAVHDPALLEPEGLARIRDLTARIEKLDGVRHVFSLANAKQLVHGDIGAVDAPLLPESGRKEDVAAALDRNPDFTGWLISPDRRTAGIVVESEEREGDHVYRSKLIAGLRALADEHAGEGISYHLTGIAVQKHDVGAYVDRDTRVLMPLAVVVIGALLAMFFRSLLGVVLPLAVTGISVSWTLGVLHLAGLRLNAITALLPPVIMVLSLAVAIHLIQSWLQTEGAPDRLARIRRAVAEVGFPCFFCSLTTMLGLLSLLIADLPAVRQFGAFAALGVAFSFIIGITFVPVGLTFLTPPKARYETPQHRFLRAGLQWSASITEHRPGLVLAIFAGITIASLFGLPHLRNNTDLVRFLESDAALYRDTMFIDENLTGAVAIEFLIRRLDDAPMTALADVSRLAEFDRAARARPHVAATTSILPVLRQLERAETGTEVLALPSDDRQTRYLFDLLEAAEDQPLIGKLVSADFRSLRMSVRVHAVGTWIAAPLAEELTADARRIFGEEYLVEPTGAFYGIARDSNTLVYDQVTSFAVGAATVFLAIAILFRSLLLTTISLIPNLMPLFWTGGMMGALGIDLSSGTAMIASAVIGLVVDDTIHYLARYREEYRGDAVATVHRTTNGIGAALVMNNVVLVVGFWVGCFGSFKPTIYFSLLTGLTLITAMLCDVFVTPALLILTDRYRRGAATVLSTVLAAALSLALVSPATAEVAIPPAVAPMLDSSAAEVIARIDVPDSTRRVGQVRIVRRSGTEAVETLLHTKLLRRVVAEIRKKEQPNWPAGAPGHDDSLKYLAALDAAQQELWSKVPQLDRNADQRQSLLIEFVLSKDHAAVVLSDYDTSGKDETLQITARRPLVVLELSRDYIARNMRLIAADSFKKQGPDLDALLAPLPLFGLVAK